MRNKVNNNITRRMTAILLSLVMIAGSFSVAVFAEDTPSAQENTTAAEEKTEKEAKPAESEQPAKEAKPAESEQPAKEAKPAESEQPAKETKPAESEKSSEAASPEADQTADNAAEAKPETVENTEKSAPSAASAENTGAVDKAAQPAEDKDSEDVTELEFAGQTAARNAALAFVYLAPGVTASYIDADGNQVSKSGDHGYGVPVGAKVQLSVNTDAVNYTFRAMSGGSALSMQDNSFVMPDARVDVEIDYFYNINADLTSANIPDGTSITVNGTTVNKGQKASVRTKAGETASVTVTTGASEYDLAVTNAKSGGAISVSDDSFTMPQADVNVTGKFYQYFTMDLTAANVPDGFYVTFNGTKTSKGEKNKIKVETNQKVVMEDVADLGSNYNYSNDRMSGNAQLKMEFAQASGTKSTVLIDKVRSEGYQIASSDVEASLYVLYSFRTSFTGTLKTCSISNLSDSSSPWYAHAGDTIGVSFDRSACSGPVGVTLKDAAGNVISQASVDSNSWTFRMPEGVAYITIDGKLAKKQYNITVRDAKNGSLKVDGTQQAEGETVTIEAVPGKGYAVSPTGIVITYQLKGKTEIIKAEVKEKGSNIFTFKMPAADVTISSAFVVPYVVKVKTNNGGKVTVDYNNDYGDYTTKGKKVQLKVTPKKGYVLKDWAAEDANGNAIKIKEDGSFLMPASNVGIGVVFGKKDSGASSTYISKGTESYYTGMIAAEDGAEVDEDVTPEDLIDLIPLTSAITARILLSVASGIGMIVAS